MAGRRLARALTAGIALLLVSLPGSTLAGTTPDGLSHSRFERCTTPSGVLCRYVSVPLDYSGATSSHVRLFVTKRPAAGVTKGTVLLLAGGPGEPSAQTFGLASRIWTALFPGYTIAAYDNRGTGASNALACPAASTAAHCARLIGPSRTFYGTRDNAEDIEAVRRALDVDRIVLFGISYGTKQALAYAHAYPEHVARLLLDSVVPYDRADPFDLSSLRGITSALGSICDGGACRAVTRHPASDFARLANRLEARPLVATVRVYKDRWAPIERRIRLDGRGLLSLARASDANAGVAIGLPAAVSAALAGRPAQLERMAALVAGEPPSDVNRAVFLATTCTDGPFPWAPDTPVSERPGRVAQAIAALPDQPFGRFGRWAAAAATTDCLGWPAPAGLASSPASARPDVPVLVLGGDRDVRTPLRAGATVAAHFPRGRLLVVPGAGHAVVGSSPCVDAAIRTWMRGGTPPARCPRVPLTIDPLGPAVPAVAAATPLGPETELVGRTLGATVATLRSAEASWLTSYPAGWVAGLEGGLLAGEDFDVFRFSAYSDIPGLAISGRVSFSVSNGGLVPGSERGMVQVGGSEAANGFLQIRRHRIFGILSGEHVSARF